MQVRSTVDRATSAGAIRPLILLCKEAKEVLGVGVSSSSYLLLSTLEVSGTNVYEPYGRAGGWGVGDIVQARFRARRGQLTYFKDFFA